MTSGRLASSRLAEVALQFLRLGATAYGGPAIMGIMQTELQEKRQWVPRERFVEGVALANLVPGATATQLGIFLGHARAGWWGGVVGGVCFILPGFVIMLGLALAYARLGVAPVVRGALYGLGPVVLGIYVVAVYRLGRSTVTVPAQGLLAAAAAAAVLGTPLGITSILLLAAGAGLALFHSRKVGATVLAAVAIGGLVLRLAVPASTATAAVGTATTPGLAPLAVFLARAGAFTFGGGLTMIAFIEEHVVRRLQWLTPQEFIEGLALGQLTPGPILVVAAYVGYKVAGLSGATVAAVAVFLPSFVLMLAALPVFDRIRTLAWTRAALRGIGPGVIGVLAVSLLQLAPHAAPDLVSVGVFVGTVLALLVWRWGTFRLMLAGSLVGVARHRLGALARLTT